MPERVLVLPRDQVPGGCDFRGVREADADALSVLGEAVARDGRYVDRPIAEDPQESIWPEGYRTLAQFLRALYERLYGAAIA